MMPLPTSARITIAANRPVVRAARASRLLCAALALTACAKQDYKSEMSRTRSWTATLELAGQQRRLRATNGAVTRQLLDRATEARSKEEHLLAGLAKSDSQRVAAGGLLDSLDQQIRQLRQVAR